MNNSLDFTALLFDLDGVLLDSMGHHAQTWQDLLASEGMEVSREFVLMNEGALGVEVLSDFLASRGLDLGDPEQGQAYMQGLLDRQAREYQENYASLATFFPGARRLLAGLREQGAPLALVTSSRKEVVQSSKAGELLDMFNVVITAGDVQRHKPHPDPYLAAARALGVEPGQCLVVENAPAGIQSAVSAGARCLAVCSTLGPEHLGQAHEILPDLWAVARRLGLDGEGR